MSKDIFDKSGNRVGSLDNEESYGCLALLLIPIFYLGFALSEHLDSFWEKVDKTKIFRVRFWYLWAATITALPILVAILGKASPKDTAELIATVPFLAAFVFGMAWLFYKTSPRK